VGAVLTFLGVDARERRRGIAIPMRCLPPLRTIRRAEGRLSRRPIERARSPIRRAGGATVARRVRRRNGASRSCIYSPIFLNPKFRCA